MRRATIQPRSHTAAPSSNADAIQQSTIRDLSQRISRIPAESPGAHTLVWVCFVAGAEANDPNERQFFSTYMSKVYEKTFFQNIPVAIESLQRICKYKGNKRRTQCLPELSPVLVM